MTEIFLIGAPLTGNFGGPSLLISTCKVLKEAIPNAKFKLWTHSPERDYRLAKIYDNKYKLRRVEISARDIYIGFIRAFLFAILKKFKIRANFLLNFKWLREYLDSEVIIDIRGITLTDYFGGRGITQDIFGYFAQTVTLLTAHLLGKPAIKFTQDMGPFNNKINRFFSKICLNRLDIIMARGEITKDLLKKIGIETPIYIQPDTAFVMDPAPIEEIKEILKKEQIDKKTLIGIVPSRQVDKRILSTKDFKLQNNYTLLLARLADYLIEKFDANIVLIPNEITHEKNGYDDVYVAKKIFKNIKNKERVRLITNEYFAPQLKGVIGKCDLLISSRYHSMVAALSMCIPTLVIGWGFKYNQIMKMVGQENFVCDYKKISLNELYLKIDHLWYNKEKIKKELADKMPSIKNSVFLGGEIVKNLIDTSP